MSELKAVHAFDVYEAYTKTGDDDAAQVYLKSEADKVIAELEESHKKEVEQLLMEIVGLKKACKDKDDWCLHTLKEARRHKYKRCLAMARYYEEEVRDSIEYMRHCGGGYDAYVNAHIEKMKKRLDKWRSLAEKFKPNSTAQQGKDEVK